MATAIVVLLCAGAHELAVHDVTILHESGVCAHLPPVPPPACLAEASLTVCRRVPCELRTVLDDPECSLLDSIATQAICEEGGFTTEPLNTPARSDKRAFHWRWSCTVRARAPTEDNSSSFGALVSHHDCVGDEKSAQMYMLSLHDAQGLCAATAGCVGIKGPYYPPAANSRFGRLLVPPTYSLCYSFYPKLPEFLPPTCTDTQRLNDTLTSGTIPWMLDWVRGDGTKPRVMLLLDAPANTTANQTYGYVLWRIRRTLERLYALPWQHLPSDSWHTEMAVTIFIDLVLIIPFHIVARYVERALWWHYTAHLTTYVMIGLSVGMCLVYAVPSIVTVSLVLGLFEWLATPGYRCICILFCLWVLKWVLRVVKWCYTTYIQVNFMRAVWRVFAS